MSETVSCTSCYGCEFELKLVTFLLPEAYLAGLDKLVEEGLYPSRSAAVRFAVQDLLRREVWRQVEVVTEEASATRKLEVKQRATRRTHKRHKLLKH